MDAIMYDEHIECRVWRLKDGWGWRITLQGETPPDDRTRYGSVRTEKARGVDPRAFYDVLEQAIRELLAEGSVPWLF